MTIWQYADTVGADWWLGALPLPLRYVVYARGYNTLEQARHYLEVTPDFDDLSGLQEAAERLHQAIFDKEGIIIYGDYDVDGITSTALFVGMLRKLGADVRSYIPNRFEEGYGLNAEAVKYFSMLKVSLLVTVDCGVRAVDEIALAKAYKKDVIVVDHHEPGDTLPPADILIDPKIDGIGFRDYAAVGLVFRLGMALRKLMNNNDHQVSMWQQQFFDLAALGTVADVAPLVGDNRYIVNSGLARLRANVRPGLQKLIQKAGVKQATLSAEDLAFMICPRLNAAGRLESAYAAYDLLLTRDTSKAVELADKLESHNSKRQRLTAKMYERAKEIAFEYDSDGLVAFATDPDFHPGVVGLVASRLVNHFYRPALVACDLGRVIHGSCRSIPGVDIIQALTACDDLLSSYGGHAAAAGFSLRMEDREQFLERLGEAVREQVGDKSLVPVLYADCEWPIEQVTPELLRQLEWLEPCGHGNEAAKFIAHGVKVNSARLVGSNKNHLSLNFDMNGKACPAIAFNKPELRKIAKGHVDIMYTPRWNTYRNVRNIQLVIHDLKEAD